jgi:hypothetical protein
MAENIIDMTKLDKRTAERYIRAGLLDEKAYERFLKSLADTAEKSAPVETTMMDDEQEEDEDADDTMDDAAKP